MSVVQRYTDFRSIFADGGVDPEADMALDGMQPWPVANLRANSIPEIALTSGALETLSFRLSINAEAADGGADFDWYFSQRTDDPDKQWFLAQQYSPVRSGTLRVELTAIGLAELGLTDVTDPVTSDQAAAALKYVDVYCLRRSDGAIQRCLMTDFL